MFACCLALQMGCSDGPSTSSPVPAQGEPVEGPQAPPPLPIQAKHDDSPEGQVRAMVDGLFGDSERPDKSREQLDALEKIAKDNPELLLPYLRDERQTSVLTECRAMSNEHVPYPVWKEIDMVLGNAYRVGYHESMESAAVHWERFVADRKK